MLDERMKVGGEPDESPAVSERFAVRGVSCGALHGSARGCRNVRRRIDKMNELGGMQGDVLLDVGCATGEYTTQMAGDHESVIAIDIEKKRLAVFERRCPTNVEIREESVADMSLRADSVDVVTMIEVLEHLPDPKAALREVCRVLRPGSSLLLTTPNRGWPIEQHGFRIGSHRLPGPAFPGLVWLRPIHRRLSKCAAFSRRDLQKLADSTGFVLDGVTYMMPPLDSLPDGHRIHAFTESVERTRLERLSQTIVARFRKPDDGTERSPMA